MDIRIEKTERAIKQAFMELRAHKPLEKIKIKDLCALACINKSTFYAHYEDIYALADAMERELVNAVLENLSTVNVTQQTEQITRELFDSFVKNQKAVNIVFSGSRQGLFVNDIEQEMRRRLTAEDPTFANDPVRGIVLSFCVQGSYYAFANHSGQMEQDKLVGLLASISRAAQRIEA